jgi:hypothetical protein
VGGDERENKSLQSPTHPQNILTFVEDQDKLAEYSLINRSFTRFAIHDEN